MCAASYHSSPSTSSALLILLLHTLQMAGGNGWQPLCCLCSTRICGKTLIAVLLRGLLAAASTGAKPAPKLPVTRPWLVPGSMYAADGARCRWRCVHAVGVMLASKVATPLCWKPMTGSCRMCLGTVVVKVGGQRWPLGPGAWSLSPMWAPCCSATGPALNHVHAPAQTS